VRNQFRRPRPPATPTRQPFSPLGTDRTTARATRASASSSCRWRTSCWRRWASGGEQDWDRFAPLFEVAQRKMERKHYRQRLDLMHNEKMRQETLEDLGADLYVD